MTLTTTPSSPDDLTFGQPPSDTTAEKAVLGGMLTARYAIDECLDIVFPQDFYWPKHETIFNAIAYLHWNSTPGSGKSQPVDAITVADYLSRQGADELARIGGQSYLHELLASVVTASNASYYAQIVHEKAMLRRLVEAGTRIVQLGYATGGGDVDDIVGAAQAEVDSVAKGQVTELVTAAETIDEMIEWTYSDQVFYSTPWGPVNKTLRGFEPGRVYTIAARPGVGKSIALLDASLWMLTKHRKAVALCSMEMGRHEVYGRMLANLANVDFGKIMNPRLLSKLECEFRDEAVAQIKKLPPLFVEDAAEQTVENMRSFARQCSNRADLGLVGIDYLQLFKPSPGRKFGNREQEVAHQSRQVKVTAKSLQVPVINLAQLNRIEGKPKLHNLRESGSIEQDSDVVVLLHREDDVETGEPLDELLGQVAKHRGGPRGGFSLFFDGPHMRFSEHEDLNTR